MICTCSQSPAGSQFIHSSVERIQSFLTRFRFPADAASTTQSYLHDLLSPRGSKTTIEVRGRGEGGETEKRTDERGGQMTGRKREGRDEGEGGMREREG